MLAAVPDGAIQFSRAACEVCAANMMIEMFGEDATLRAAMRSDALLEQGDAEGFFVWKRIARAIDHLSQQERQPGEQQH